MQEQESFDLSEFPAGPKILHGNVFRVAQMPVDSPDRKLKRRQQRISQAGKMGLEIPVGDSPLFPLNNSNPEDDIKEAMHRVGDPVYRLFDELFWFWPAKFGCSEVDPGLALLAENKTEETVKLWTQDEKETKSLQSTHNLALLHLLLALEFDASVINSGTQLQAGGDGIFGIGRGAKSSNAQWKNAFSRWTLLSQRDEFWQYVDDRIRAIDNPQLPPAFTIWLRQNFPSILLSFNISLAMDAAKKGLTDHLEYQKKLINESGFEPDEINNAIDFGVKQLRTKIKKLNRKVEADIKQNPERGRMVIGDYLEIATPSLKLICNLYPAENLAIDVLHDEVVNTLRDALTAYAIKTQEWKPALELLEQIGEFSRGSKVTESIVKDKEWLKSRLDMDFNWVEEGYFDLPEACVEELEEAREAKESDTERALEILRNALQGVSDLPADSKFHQHLIHCIAFCLELRANEITQQYIQRRNYKLDELLQSSVARSTHGIQITSNYGINCRSCNSLIEDRYFNRSIPGVGDEVPFCVPCSDRLDAEIERLELETDVDRQQARDMIELANHFNPGNKAILETLEIIRENGSPRSIQATEIEQLIDELEFVSAGEFIRRFISDAHDREAIFSNLSNLIDRQSEGAKEQSLAQLFEAVLSAGSIRAYFPILHKNQYIFSKFMRYALFSEQVSEDKRRAFVEAVCVLENYLIKFEVIELISKLSDSEVDLVDQIVSSLSRNVEILAKAGIDSFEDGKCGDLLSRARKFDQELEWRLFDCFLDASSKQPDVNQITHFYRAIFGSSRYLDPFFKNVFSAGDEKKFAKYESLRRGLKNVADTDVMFAGLLELRERGANENAIHQLETYTSQLVVELAKSLLPINAAYWIDGELGRALRFARAYKPAFEKKLVTDILNAIEQRDKFTINLITASSLLPNHHQFLRDFLEVNESGPVSRAQQTCYEILAFHWDSEFRLAALKWFIATSDDDELVRIALIRYLADENPKVRDFARDELVIRISNSIDLCVEALATDNEQQRDALTKVLAEQELSIEFKSPPTITQLIISVFASTGTSQLDVIQRLVDRFYPAPSKRDFSQGDLSVLKYIKAKCGPVQSDIADRLLKRVSGLSVFMRSRVNKTPIKKPIISAPWWDISFASKPALPSQYNDLLGSLDARKYLKEGDKEGRRLSQRKVILEMVDGSSEHSLLCPVCNTAVIRSNLIKHYDKWHENDSNIPIAPEVVSIDILYPDDFLGREILRAGLRLQTIDEDADSKNFWFRRAVSLAIIVGAGWIGANSEHPDVVELREPVLELMAKVLQEADSYIESSFAQVKEPPPVEQVMEAKAKLPVPSAAPLKETTPTTKVKSPTEVKPQEKPVLSREEMREAQTILTMLGHNPGPADGLWGGKTLRSMQAFQRKSGFEVTAVMDIETFAHLRASKIKMEAKRKAEQAKLADAVNKAEKTNQALGKQKRQEAEPSTQVTRKTDKNLKDYILSIRQKVERNWIEPKGISRLPACEVHVLQGPGGIIKDVTFGSCTGGVATYRASIKNAIYKAEPLPKPRDPSLFDEELIFVFKPKG